MTTDTFHDLETFSPTPLKNGTHIYAEAAEVMLWAFCVEDGTIYVWDLVNSSLHWVDDLAECWVSRPLLEGVLPHELSEIIDDPEMLVWFQNGGMFDFVVLQRALPAVLDRIAMTRWRDTMVQAFAHSLPGSLEKLGEVLNLHEDKRKLKRGKALVQLFCKPRPDGSRATKDTHPTEWQEFIEYAGGDITTMREARRLMPSWNYKGKQIELWHRDLVVNYRGFAVDVELAQAAVRMAARVQAKLAEEVHTATDGDVNSATQRDAFMEFLVPLMAEYGVDLPDMKADTLERRVDDPDLPEFIKDLLRIRLQASMNSVSKFKTLLKGVSSDHRLRGTMQFRGAGRTGREAHRMFQPGNLPRPTLSHELVEYAIDRLKADDLEGLEMVFPSVMLAMSNTIRGAIVAGEGKKIVVSDLSNIEGRVAAWLAGEAWKLDAFRDYDTILVGDDGKPLLDKKGKPKRKGLDLYVKSYMSSFNIVEAALVGTSERQIGKVCLAKGSLVLTNSGWLPIERVTEEHKLWDGVEWVRHQGLLSQGIKSVISLGALHLTPDHSVLCGAQWREAGTLLRDPFAHSQALARGVARLPSRATLSALWVGLRQCSFVAIAGALSMAFSRTTSAAAEVVDAPNAANEQSQTSGGGSTLTRCLKRSTAFGFFSGSRQHAYGALHPTMPGGRTTAAAASGSATSGSTTGQRFLRTFERFLGGITQTWKWIAETPTVTTNLATFSSSPSGRTFSTAGVFLNFKPKSIGSEKKMPTFDLACAGPRKRFTVLTSRGPLIVHNCELMFQYGGGVGAWLTGAATYGIDLNKMTDQVWPVLADWAKEESAKFLQWLYETENKKHEKRYLALSRKFNDQVPQAEHDALLEQWSAAKLKARYGLSEKTFVACDAIKRLWRTAHPAISSYWKEIEETVREAIRNPGVTLHCRKVKVRRDGAWLRCGLPSGRALCYPNPGITEDGKIYYTGHNPYNRQWGKVYTYGGKLFENWTQAVACDQLFECLPLVEDAGYAVVLDVHDEYVTEVPDSEEYTADELACIMCSNLGWNEGLPLAAAGFSCYRYRKE